MDAAVLQPMVIEALSPAYGADTARRHSPRIASFICEAAPIHDCVLALLGSAVGELPEVVEAALEHLLCTEPATGVFAETQRLPASDAAAASDASASSATPAGAIVLLLLADVFESLRVSVLYSCFSGLGVSGATVTAAGLTFIQVTVVAHVPRMLTFVLFCVSARVQISEVHQIHQVYSFVLGYLTGGVLCSNFHGRRGQHQQRWRWRVLLHHPFWQCLEHSRS